MLSYGVGRSEIEFRKRLVHHAYRLPGCRILRTNVAAQQHGNPNSPEIIRTNLVEARGSVSTLLRFVALDGDTVARFTTAEEPVLRVSNRSNTRDPRQPVAHVVVNHRQAFAGIAGRQEINTDQHDLVARIAQVDVL